MAPRTATTRASARLPAGALRLVAITDDLRDGVSGLASRAAAAVRGGATMIQLRLKDIDSQDLLAAARALVALPVPVIVNDRVDVALAAGAAGVHVGAEGLPVDAVRRVVPAQFIIGASVGSEADIALADGADYAGVGPIFATTPATGTALGAEIFERIVHRIDVPVIAIGGIDTSNCRDALGAGATGIAVIRAIFAAPDPEAAARALSSAIES